MHQLSAVVCLRLEHSVICQTFAPAWRQWRSCNRSRPPAFITSFADPAVDALRSALHDCLTDEPSQPTGLTTPVLQECFHGNRLRSCEKKQETEGKRQTDVHLQHCGFLTFPSSPGDSVALHLLHVKKTPKKHNCASGCETCSQLNAGQRL